jgi:hypothetical protein
VSVRNVLWRTLRGNGWFSKEDDNTRIADVRYHIQFWRTMMDDGFGGEIPGTFTRVGTFISSGLENPFSLHPHLGKSLKLNMENGRTVSITINALKGGDGGFILLGEFDPPLDLTHRS